MSFEADAKFAYKLLTLIEDDALKKSILFSPFSILTGMTMFYVGAKEETEKEIAPIIGNEKADKSEIIESYSKLIDIYKTDYSFVDKSDVKVTVGNKLFISKKCKLLPKFCETINKKFDGGFQQIDFGDNNKAAMEINLIVKRTTNGQIEKIIFENDINCETTLVLVNALHFCAPWKDPFFSKHNVMFNSNPPREVEMMRYAVMADYKWNLTEHEKWYALGIPYKDFKAWMYIILPKENSSLKELLENMNDESFKEWTKRTIYSHLLMVTMPLFDVSYDFELKDKFQKLGVNTAFTNSCNLGDMMKCKSKLYKILHSSHISVDEYGTEASAATSHLVMSRNGHKDFTVNRPFLYFVTTSEKETEEYESFDEDVSSHPLNILFVGTFC